jgi:NAD-dependent oxidoreductase involved in siderophore biosynthesis
MRIAKFFLMLVSLASVSSLALAQRGAHHSGGVFGRPVIDLQERMKIQATDEQRTQLRACSELSDRLRALATSVRNPRNLSKTELEGVHQQWSATLLQAMQGNHLAFVGSLNADQQAALKGRLRKMGKVWSELASRFEGMDRDLAQTPPDTKRLAGHAKEVEKTIRKWQKQHREIEAEMGIQG